MRKLLLALLFIAGVSLRAQTCPAYTPVVFSGQVTINDTLFNTDGSLAQGTITVSWTPTFVSVDGHTNQASCFKYNVINGVLSIALEPNVGSVPSGTFYTAQYAIYGGPTRYTEDWVVPAIGPTNLAGVRTTPAPTTSFVIALSQLSTAGASPGQCPTFNGTSVVWGACSAASAVVYNGPNTATGPFTLNAAAATSPNALIIPNVAGCITSVTGAVCIDTTNKNFHVNVNATDSYVAVVGSVPTNGACPSWVVVSGTISLSPTGTCGGGGGGSGYFSGLLDNFPLTKSSATVMMIDTNASSAQPSIFAAGNTSHAFTSPGSVTISGTSDSGNVYWCLQSAGTIAVKTNQSFTLTGSGVGVVTGQTSCTSDGTHDSLIWQSHVTANVWDAVTEAMDFRWSLRVPDPIAGSGPVVITDNNVTRTISLTQAGNSNIVANASGSFTSGHCIEADSNSNFIDAGSGCGSGGGLTTPTLVTTAVGTTSGMPGTPSGFNITIPASKLASGNAVHVEWTVNTTNANDNGYLTFNAGSSGSTSNPISYAGTLSTIGVHRISCTIWGTGVNTQVAACTTGFPAFTGDTQAVTPFTYTTTGTMTISAVQASGGTGNTITSYIMIMSPVNW